MTQQLIDLIPMDPATRETYRAMPSPARAWALAKAAFELAHEANFAEQAAATAAATTDDPEPKHWSDLGWKAWYDRNEVRIDAATKPIVARYPNDLQQLAKLAEQNMVDWAEEQLQKQVGDRFAAVKPAFEAYRENLLFGDMRERFIKICFNCPA